MSITVADCLKLPSLREGIVIAGHEGLHHIVNNISVLEITSEEQISRMRTDEEPINNFEICLTSFSQIADDPQAQCRLIRYLSDIGDVCLVIYYVGIIVKEISPALTAVADSLNFTLVIMPPGRTEYRYSEVIRDVCDLLFKDRASSYNFHNTLALTLSKLPESKRTISNLLKITSDTTCTTLLLSDTSHLSSLLSPWPTSNLISQTEIIDMFCTGASGTNNQDIDKHEDEMVISTYLNHVVHIFRIKFMSYNLRHYFLYFLDEGGKLTLQDAREITDVIQLLSELWNLGEDEISDGSLIHAILNDNSEKMLTLSQKYCFDLTEINMLISIHVTSDGDISGKINRRLELQRIMKNFSRENSHRILFNTYDDYFILFMKMEQNSASAEDLAENLKKHLAGFQCSITMMQADLHEVRDMFRLYERCCLQAEKIFLQKSYLTYADLLFVNSCIHIYESKESEKRIFDSAIEKLRTLQDSKSITDTLTVYYLDTDCRISETAEILYLHRNTVKYRLKKAHSLLHTHFGNSIDLYFIQILAAYLRLSESNTDSYE